MTTKRNEFLAGLARLFEVESVGAEFVLEPWDSLNVMSTVVLIDEVYGKVTHGRALQDCVTVGDVLKIAESA